jgi:hypothetical protein
LDSNPVDETRSGPRENKLERGSCSRPKSSKRRTGSKEFVGLRVIDTLVRVDGGE